MFAARQPEVATVREKQPHWTAPDGRKMDEHPATECTLGDIAQTSVRLSFAGSAHVLVGTKVSEQFGCSLGFCVLAITYLPLEQGTTLSTRCIWLAVMS
jgi:hypothetical protein